MVSHAQWVADKDLFARLSACEWIRLWEVRQALRCWRHAVAARRAQAAARALGASLGFGCGPDVRQAMGRLVAGVDAISSCQEPSAWVKTPSGSWVLKEPHAVRSTPRAPSAGGGASAASSAPNGTSASTFAAKLGALPAWPEVGGARGLQRAASSAQLATTTPCCMCSAARAPAPAVPVRPRSTRPT